MKKIVILGCENSHAKNFLSEIKNNPAYSDYEVLGIYSDETEPAEKLSADFGVPVMASYDEAVGKVDAIIITARHGANHYKYAKPYIKSGIPMFIDKPITIDTEEALTFMRELRENGVRVTGGSSGRQADEIIKLKEDHINGVGGECYGGCVRAPLDEYSPYGGFFFYAQHLTEMVMEIFGRYPKSVKAYSAGKQKTVIFRYEKYDVVGIFSEGSWKYYAARFAHGGSYGGELNMSNSGIWFKREFAAFNALVDGGEQQMSFDDFVAPVFVMNAIKESMDSGEEVVVKEYKV